PHMSCRAPLPPTSSVPPLIVSGPLSASKLITPPLPPPAPLDPATERFAAAPTVMPPAPRLVARINPPLPESAPARAEGVPDTLLAVERAVMEKAVALLDRIVIDPPLPTPARA